MSRKRNTAGDQSADRSNSSESLEPDYIMADNMIKFLRPSTGTYFIILILLLFVFYLSYPAFLYFGKPPINYLYLILLLAEIAYCIFSLISIRQKYNAYIKGLSERGEFMPAVEDFSKAGLFFNGRFRPGDQYVFVSGAGKIFAYDEIALVYETVQYDPRRSKESPEFWCLKVRLAEGGDDVLSIIRAKRTQDTINNELKPALNWIKKKAPHIKIAGVINMPEKRTYYTTLAGYLLIEVFMITGVLFFAYGQDRAAFHGRTADTQAIVTRIEKEVHTVYERSTSREKTSFYITLNYDAGSASYETRKYSGDYYCEYVEGQKIMITYNTEDPSQIYLPGFEEEMVRFYSIAVGFLLVMVFILLRIEGKY